MSNQTSVPDAKKVADRRWSIKPKDLRITWGEESSYWRIDEEGDGPAELLEVCWLEVKGSVPDVTKGKKYEIKFKLSKKAHKFFGWDGIPVFIMAKIGNESEDQLSEEILLSGLGEEPDETTATFQIQFDNDKKTDDQKTGDKKTDDKKTDDQKPGDKKTDDQKTGDKKTDDQKTEPKLYFGLYEVWSSKWKGGLLIHEAIVQEVTADASASGSASASASTTS